MIETLSDIMEDKECPRYLHRGHDDINTKYLSGIGLPYPFYILKQQDKITIVARKRDEQQIQEQTNHSFMSYEELLSGDHDMSSRLDISAELESISEFLDRRGIDDVRVSPDFPSYVTDRLRITNVDVHVLESDILTKSRVYKSKEEIENIREIQGVTETIMREIREMISRSDIGNRDELVLDGEILTSEIIKERARDILEDHEAEMTKEMIVSCGSQTVGPHNSGSGRLEAHEPILCDVFPRGSHGYFGDMSRTFVKGEPSEKLANMHKTVEEAIEDCIEHIQEGKGNIHDVASGTISDEGYQTEIGAEEGFVHFVGHGVGLEIHERPSLNGECESLEEGMVVTVEPAIYKENYGGVRIEDMVLITKDGVDNLNQMDYDMIVD